MSRKLGQYRLQSMLAAQLDDIIASVRNAIFKNEFFIKYKSRKNTVADTNARKIVKSIFLFNLSYKKTATNAVMEMIKVALPHLKYFWQNKRPSTKKSITYQ